MSRSSSSPSRRRRRRCYAIIVNGDYNNISGDISLPGSYTTTTECIKLTQVSLIHLNSSGAEASTAINTCDVNDDGVQTTPSCWLVHHNAMDDSIIDIQTISHRNHGNNIDNDVRSPTTLSEIQSLFTSTTCYAIHNTINHEPGAHDNKLNDDDKQAFSAECIQFLQTVLSSWYSKQFLAHSPSGHFDTGMMSRANVHYLCQSVRARYHHRREQHSYRHCYCPCDDFNCIANVIVSELGLDADELNCPNIMDTMKSQQLQPSQESSSRFRNRWGLMLVNRSSNPIMSGGKSLPSPIQEEQLPEPHYRKSTNLLVSLLSQYRKRPLTAITLCPSQTSSGRSNTILTDALLRACIKRLLVGKIVLHSEVPMNNNERTLSIRTRLIVSIPRKNPSSSRPLLEDDNTELFEFRVMCVQSTMGNQEDTNEHPTQFAILPSTKITFQLCEGDGQSLQNDNKQSIRQQQQQQQSYSRASTEDVSQRNWSETLASSSRVAQNNVLMSSPHQHIVESLRSIMTIQSKNNAEDEDGRLPIPRSFILTGPPGVGKTFSVKKAISIANSWSLDPTRSNQTTGMSGPPVRLISLRGSELLASSGGSYANAARALKRQFDMARNICIDTSSHERVKAVIVFLDECDALVSSPVVAAMLAVLLDKMEGGIDMNHDSSGWDRVIVVAATNRVDAIPNFLRRPGRLEKEVAVSPPTAEERYELLKSMLGSSGCDAAHAVGEDGLQKVAEACVGYVAADLSALVRKAAMISIEKLFHDQNEWTELSLIYRPMITANDLYSAMNDVGASCLRDASLSAPPKTTWNDIAGDAGGAKRALREALEWPRIYKNAFKALGLSPPRGVLLHGPPGCAKTTLARAAAGAAGVAFLSLSPADVYASSYVGEAEAVVRRAFDLARSAAPCVLFFDELDAVIGGDNIEGGGKNGNMSRGSSAEARVLSTFLNEMDGVDGSVEDGVLVLGATNRPSMLDAALLRPGRFDRVIYVPPPDEVGRKAILLMEFKKWHASLHAYSTPKDAMESSTCDSIPPTDTDYSFNLDMLASDEISGSMTGAELVGACRQAAVQVMQSILESSRDFDNKFSSEMVERNLQSLLSMLKAVLASKTPLLSNAAVLDEYTRFERDRKEK